MRKCLVIFCGNRNGETKGINFYRLTKKRYEPWMRALGRDPTSGKVAINTNVICEEHFTKDSFLYINNRKVLQKSSVPTLKLKPERYKNVLKWRVDKQSIPGKIELQPAESISLNISLVNNADEPSASNYTCAPNESISEKSSPIIVSNKRKLENNSATDSENLKHNPKKKIDLNTLFHDYSLPPAKIEEEYVNKRKSAEKYVKQVKGDIEKLEETLRTSEACIERLMEKVDHLKGIAKDLEKKNDQ